MDPVADFALRLDALHLAERREAEGLGSFLGGRIRLLPHQLHAAEQAAAAEPVRWLLADEVGLGKTIEACLVLSHLVRTGRADRCLVVAPETLTVQWLGELWRKYHQVFVLLDEARLADVARDHGPDFNPFDVHRRAVIALETLVSRPELTRQAVEASIDLLVVDEAHHLRRPLRHPGNAAWRAIAPSRPSAGTSSFSRRSCSTTTCTASSGCSRCCARPTSPRTRRSRPGSPASSRCRPARPRHAAFDVGGMPPRVGGPVESPAGNGATGWPSSRRCATLPRPTPSAGA